MKYLLTILFFTSHIAFAQETVEQEKNCEDDAKSQVTENQSEDCISLLPVASGAAAVSTGTGSATSAAGTAVSTAKVATFAKGLSAKALISTGVGLGALAAIDGGVSTPDIPVPPPVEPPVEPPTEPPTTTPSTSDTGTSGTDSTGSTSGTSSTVSG